MKRDYEKGLGRRGDATERKKVSAFFSLPAVPQNLSP